MTSIRPSIRNPQSAIRTGFTFAEVMFAVMILGIGFIMVAAMFPVAIRQTQSTVEDINGVAEAQRGQAIIRQLGVSLAGYLPLNNTPPYSNLIIDTPGGTYVSNRLYSFFDANSTGLAPIDVVKGNLINQLDPRFAWVPVAYQTPFQSMDPATNAPLRLDANGNAVAAPAGTLVIPSTAKIWIVAVQKRDPDSPTYTNTDRDSGIIALPPVPVSGVTRDRRGCFKPKQVYFKLVEGEAPDGTASYPDTIVFTDSSGSPTEEPAAAEGAYVWVADDQVAVAPTIGSGPNGMYRYQPGDANGRFYRLGTHLDPTAAPTGFGPGVWELLPGTDMSISPDSGPDGLTNTADDGPPKLENLPPRPYDSSPPYVNHTYASIPAKPAIGFMIGRALKDPTQIPSGNNPYVGGSQDLLALPPVSINLRTR